MTLQDINTKLNSAKVFYIKLLLKERSKIEIGEQGDFSKLLKLSGIIRYLTYQLTVEEISNNTETIYKCLLTIIGSTDSTYIVDPTVVIQQYNIIAQVSGIPIGGLTAQVLKKTSGADYQVEWDYINADSIGEVFNTTITLDDEDLYGVNFEEVTSREDFDALKNALVPHPVYTNPTLTITSPQSSTSYEVGANTTLTLNLNFTQNDAGSIVSSSIKRDTIEISTQLSTTDNINFTTTPVLYNGSAAYNTGLIKNNILGEPDATGRIMAGMINSNTLSFIGYYRIFYGTRVSPPTNSAEARALPQNRLTNSGNTFNLDSGTTNLYQTLLLPPGKSLSTIIDLDASNQNITSQYILTNNNFTVNDLAGNPVTGYYLYIRTQGSPYLSNHRHQITII